MKATVFNILLFLALLSGCKASKEVSKQYTAKTSKETLLTKSKRQGDSISVVIPSIKYKDTTIYSYNRVGTQLITRYGSNGELDVKCIESSVDEFKLAVKELKEESKQKEKTETTETKDTFIIGGFVLVGLVLFYLIYRIESVIKVIS